MVIFMIAQTLLWWVKLRLLSIKFILELLLFVLTLFRLGEGGGEPIFLLQTLKLRTAGSAEPACLGKNALI